MISKCITKYNMYRVHKIVSRPTIKTLVLALLFLKSTENSAACVGP